MKGKILAIYTRDPEYARCLSEYILGRRELLFQVMVFPEMENLKKFAKEHRIDFLLLDDDLDNMEKEKIGQIYCLRDERGKEKNDGCYPIYKYQSGEKIVAEILSHCAEEEGNETILRIQKSNVEIIGVYSPIHRVGRTQYALQLGKEFARKGNTLYLNLEEYSGEWRGEEVQDGLAELLYYLRQGCKNIGIRIETLVKHYESVDYLEPMGMYQDLKSVTAEEWKQLLMEVAEKSIYQTIVLDLGDAIQGTYELLEVCSCIYTPFVQEETAQLKMRQYRENLIVMGLESVIEKTIFTEVKEFI